MNTTPTAHNSDRPLPPVWRVRRNLRIIAGLIGVTVLVVGAIAVFGPNEHSGPGWAAPEVLPEAEPVWTQTDVAVNGVLIHDDLLVREFGSGLGPEAMASDLSTGDTMWRSDHSRVWLSGEHFIGMKGIKSEAAVVYDIGSGAEVRTIPVTKFATVTVASGILVSVEATGDDDSRMRGIDVATGDVLWTQDLNKSQRQWKLGAPNRRWQVELSPSPGVFAESTSPVVLLHREATPNASVWDRVDAIDVSTGERRWTSPLEYELNDNPNEHGYMLTKGGDIYTNVWTGLGDDVKLTSYVIDMSSGKETAYPAPASAFDDEIDFPLHGDHLQTSDGDRPQICDIASGKVLWRAKEKHGTIVHHGDVVFEETRSDPEEPGQSYVDGVRATDVATGRTLWTREGVVDTRAIGVADDVVTTGFAKPSADEPPIQVFDRDSGKGKWQIRATRLAAYNDDYFVFIESQPTDNVQLDVVSRKNPR